MTVVAGSMAARRQTGTGAVAKIHWANWGWCGLLKPWIPSPVVHLFQETHLLVLPKHVLQLETKYSNVNLIQTTSSLDPDFPQAWMGELHHLSECVCPVGMVATPIFGNILMSQGISDVSVA